MAALAVTVLWLVMRPEDRWSHHVKLAIWLLFVLDYMVRLACARDRRAYVLVDPTRHKRKATHKQRRDA